MDKYLFVLIILGAVAFYYVSKYVLINKSPIILTVIKLFLAIGVVFSGYLIFDTIDSKMKLTAEVEHRKTVLKDHLNHVKVAQIAFKKKKGYYARDFRQLTHFLENDSIVQVKAIGEVPDSLLGQEALALEMGIIIRDTTLIPVREEIFKGEDFDAIVKDMGIIPFSEGKQFEIEAGEIEKGTQKMKVFEVRASYKDIFKGMKVKNEGVDLDKFMILGSMTEGKTTGNWTD